MPKLPVEPSLMKANDPRVLVNGSPLEVDFRIISEEAYQLLQSFLPEFKSSIIAEIEKEILTTSSDQWQYHTGLKRAIDFIKKA